MQKYSGLFTGGWFFTEDMKGHITHQLLKNTNNSKSKATTDIYRNIMAAHTNFGTPWKTLAPIGCDESDKMATRRPNNRQIRRGTSKK